jgi:CHASE2 domain-containing sensor protein
MLRKVLVITGGSLNIAWGISHLFPTYSVAAGFGKITADNRNIILMEWINEGLTLIFIGVLVVLVTALTKEINKTIKTVYAASAAMLFSMAVLSLFTGFNIDFIPFKLCPVIFSLSGILILQGVWRK